MNVINLTYALDLTSVAGHTLSQEEIYVVQNALLILQGENHFKNVYFMGKLFGIEKDYYLAFGYRSDALTGRSFFYSNNQYDWFLLGEPSPCALKLTPRVSQRFTGDPSQIIDWRDAGDSSSVTGRGSVLKEEDRLSAVVYTLHEDCAIAPKGAFFLDVEGVADINPTFQGLSLQQGTDARWWEQTHKKEVTSSGDFQNTFSLCRCLELQSSCTRQRQCVAAPRMVGSCSLSPLTNTRTWICIFWGRTEIDQKVGLS